MDFFSTTKWKIIRCGFSQKWFIAPVSGHGERAGSRNVHTHNLWNSRPKSNVRAANLRLKLQVFHSRVRVSRHSRLESMTALNAATNSNLFAKNQDNFSQIEAFVAFEKASALPNIFLFTEIDNSSGDFEKFVSSKPAARP